MNKTLSALATVIIASGSGAHARSGETPVLTILTYDSFVSEWGPGPRVEAAFEEVCGCDLRFRTAGDGAAILGRIRLEGPGSDIDIALGIDTGLTAAAAETGLFAEHGLSPALDVPGGGWSDVLFLPYDYGAFAFVHRKEDFPTPPGDFRELAESDARIVIQDPRSSTPGLGLLLWVKAAHGDEAESIWRDLSDNILTVTKGWSEAYGLFIDGEADMALSYTTSPAYHRIAEGDDGIAAAIFDEGHYLQVEVAGALAGSDTPELARRFLEFMTTDAFQSIIPTTNWMYPAVMPEGGLPEGFVVGDQPTKTLLFPPEEARDVRDMALSEWLTALGG